jgi:hypothetical protein
MLLLGVGAAGAQQAGEKIPNETCLGRHGDPGFSVPGPDGQPHSLFLDKDKFGQSVHGVRSCVDCHKQITEVPHEKLDRIAWFYANQPPK